VESAERGALLETLVLHELRAAQAYQNLGGQLHYWRTPSGSEVDFVWTRGARAVGVEVKASTVWRREHGAALRALLGERQLTSGHGVYTGTAELKDGQVRVWPIRRFLALLAAGEILA
jgi:predicted AAA+ superfamily ATPase